MRIPADFVYIPDIITEQEENKLIARIQALDWQKVIMHGLVAKRRVVHFGLNYLYGSRSVKPTIKPPLFLKKLIKKAEDIYLNKNEKIEQVLVTYYPPGAGVSWHRDAPIFEKVFGISLGSDCVLKLRIQDEDKYEIFKINLAPRSAYILCGEARWKWQHSIPPVKEDRFSITLRTLVDS